VQELVDASPEAAQPGEHPRETIRLQRTHGFSRVLAPRELWRYRDVGFQMAARDVKVRYRQTVLGAAWAVLQPVLTMLVFSLFFGRLAHISSEGAPYPLFSLAGLVPWTFFATAVLLGSDSLVSNAPLVSKIYFPRIFIPAGVVAAGLLDLSIAFVILVAIVLSWGIVPPVAIFVVPFLLAIALAAALGVTSGLSAVNVRYRDVRYIVPFAVQLWLFATPIAYPSSVVHGAWRTALGINPMAGVVEGFRWAVLGSNNHPWGMIGVSAASSLIVLVAGLSYFDWAERRFADVL
jgi:lipopolysaccharide transport system permease protein